MKKYIRVTLLVSEDTGSDSDSTSAETEIKELFSNASHDFQIKGIQSIEIANPDSAD